MELRIDPVTQCKTHIVFWVSPLGWPGWNEKHVADMMFEYFLGAIGKSIPSMYGIFTYMYHKNRPFMQVNVPYMDGMGKRPS